jgi:hypothetical protein
MWRTWLERTLARRNAATTPPPARPAELNHADTEVTELCASPREAQSPTSVPSVTPW